jgi:type VI protein secretion system component Hcp
MSASLLRICHDGDLIPKIELQAIRYGGGDKAQIPFLRMIFERVYLREIKLNLANAGRPSEDIEFEYEIVNIEILRTDNATGRQVIAAADRAKWDITREGSG